MLIFLPPATGVSVKTSVFMEFSGLTHGPPLEDQPGQLNMQRSMPSRSASVNANLMQSTSCGLS